VSNCATALPGRALLDRQGAEVDPLIIGRDRDSGGSNVEHRPGNRGELKFRDAFYLHHGLKGGGRDGIEDILRPRDRRGRSHEIR
jgi:hypothetical protein